MEEGKNREKKNKYNAFIPLIDLATGLDHV